jgi:hypothetical protein
MKLLLLLILIINFGVSAIGMPALYSFYEINSKGTLLNEKRITINGFLTARAIENETLIYICPSKGLCYSVTKDRIKISLSKDFSKNILNYDNCHVSINGYFKYDSNQDITRSIGALSDVMDISLAISRSDYQDFNDQCQPWNIIVNSMSKLEESERNMKKKEFERKMESRGY